jgi:hypothetical protein
MCRPPDRCMHRSADGCMHPSVQPFRLIRDGNGEDAARLLDTIRPATTLQGSSPVKPLLGWSQLTTARDERPPMPTPARHDGPCPGASLPSGILPVTGSIPAMPEQKTKPPAATAWLYGPSAAGA